MQLASAAQRPDKSTRTQQRERILDALFQVMSASGTVGASVSEIAEAAGIARGALHYYFANKDELVAALMRRMGDAYLERLRAFIDSNAADPARARTVVGGVVRWHFAGNSDEAARLLAVWIDFWGQAPSQPVIGAVVFDVQEQARALCAQAVLAARPELAVLDDVTQRMFGATILAVIEGGLLQWRIAARSGRPLDSVQLGRALAAAAAAATSSFSGPAGEVL
jgi:AcrR family transcriptional regulator